MQLSNNFDEPENSNQEPNPQEMRTAARPKSPYDNAQIFTIDLQNSQPPRDNSHYNSLVAFFNKTKEAVRQASPIPLPTHSRAEYQHKMQNLFGHALLLLTPEQIPVTLFNSLIDNLKSKYIFTPLAEKGKKYVSFFLSEARRRLEPSATSREEKATQTDIEWLSTKLQSYVPKLHGCV